MVARAARSEQQRRPTSTNVWIHATLERSDSALKLEANQRYRVPPKQRATRRAGTPDFCATSQLEREAAGAHVGAVRHYSAVLKVMYGAVLGFWSADRKVFEQSQRVICTSVTLQKLQKTEKQRSKLHQIKQPHAPSMTAWRRSQVLKKRLLT